MLKLTVYGTPVGKGALKCVGAVGGVRHRLIASNDKTLKPWADKITDAAAKAHARGHRFAGPVGVYMTFTFPRPVTARHVLPITRTGGDLDHHVRSVLDGCTAGGLWADDSQVVMIEAASVYADTPLLVDEEGNPIGRAGRLQEPGVVLWVYGVQLLCGTCDGAGEILDPNGPPPPRANAATCPDCHGQGVR